MSTTKRFMCLYIVATLVFLLGIYLVKRSERTKYSSGSPLLPLASWQENRSSKISPRPSQAPSLNSNPWPVPSGQNSITLSPVQDESRSSEGAPYTKSYMFTLRIPEQMTMSTIHFHQFLNLVNDWNFTSVEPFVYSASSTLYGLRSLHAPKDSIAYNVLYNVTLQNKYMSECMKRKPDPETGHPTLFVPMIDFLRYSYRKLVLVYFTAHAGPQVLPNSICAKVDGEVNKQKEPFTDCSSAAKTHGMFDRIEQLLSKEEEVEGSYTSMDGSPSPLPEHLERFQVVQAFCIKKGVRISLRDLKTFIFNRTGALRSVDGTNKFSIIFISWQGRFTHPLVDSDVKNYINNCRIPWSTPFYSDYVKNAARRYIDSLGFHGQPYLSVHIRFEKLYENIRNNRLPVNQFLDCCTKRLNTVISAVMKKFNISEGNTVLNWDYSPYGSTVCPIPHCGNIANEHLKKVVAKPTYAEPKKLGLPSNRGLIALVEMNALYNGKALVTVGDGSYQLTIIDTFVATHRALAESTAAADKVKELQYGHVCVSGKEDVHELANTLGPKC